MRHLGLAFFQFPYLSSHASSQKNVTQGISGDLGLIYHLNRGKEGALMGKQMTFRKVKWAFRRIDGRYDSFVRRTNLGVVQASSLR